MAKRNNVDTPRKGSWAATVNTTPLPTTSYDKLTLEGKRDVLRGYSINGKGERTHPPKVHYNDPIADIIRYHEEMNRHNERELIFARMNGHSR